MIRGFTALLCENLQLGWALLASRGILLSYPSNVDKQSGRSARFQIYRTYSNIRSTARFQSYQYYQCMAEIRTKLIPVHNSYMLITTTIRHRCKLAGSSLEEPAFWSSICSVVIMIYTRSLSSIHTRYIPITGIMLITTTIWHH